jgi:integrase
MNATQSTHKSKSKPSWPSILAREYPSGKTAFQIAVMVDGQRIHETFKTRAEAETRAQEIRAMRQREGAAAFTRPMEHRVEAVDYYVKHVLIYRNAPTVREIVAKLVEEKQKANKRPATLIELKHRLGHFANVFGDRHLSEITGDELSPWIQVVGKSPFSQRNYRKKLIQLWRYGIRKKWCVENVAEETERPELDETVPGILTAEQCTRLLEHAPDFDMMPCCVLGLFCGIRTDELSRLTWPAVNLLGRMVTIGPKVAKKRRQRIIPLNDAALAWLTPYAKRSGPVVDPQNQRKRFDAWRAAAGIKAWPDNALRLSFGSYHLAAYGDEIKTAMLMGHRNADILHQHYKALVTKAEAERFWALRPATDGAAKIAPLAVNQ